MQAPPGKLSVSAILLGIVGGIIGLAAGLFLGFTRLPDSLKNGLPGSVKEVERVVLNALGTTVLQPGIFWTQHRCEKLAFGKVRSS